MSKNLLKLYVLYVYVRSKRELFECDVAYFSKKAMVEANNELKYLLCIIDVFSKFVYLYPLKSITCEDVIICFEDLFRKCGKLPKKIYTDKGSEFKVNVYCNTQFLNNSFLVSCNEDIFISSKY